MDFSLVASYTIYPKSIKFRSTEPDRGIDNFSEVGVLASGIKLHVTRAEFIYLDTSKL